MKYKLFFRIFFLALGCVLIALLIRRLGVDTIIDNIRTLGWKTPLLLLIPLAWYILYTFAWNEFLKGLKGSIGFWELLRAKIAGEAVNCVTPAGFLGGDPVRAYILKKHFPITEGAASVVVDRTLHSTSVLIVVFLGAITAFWKFHFLPLNMRYGLPIILFISFVFIAFVFFHQRRGFFTFIIHILKKTRLKRNYSAKTVAKIQELDSHISDFYTENPRGFWAALALHFGGRIVGIMEIYIVGEIFYPGFTFYIAFLLGALAPVVNFLFAFIPGAVGVMEGAYSGLLYLLGLPPGVGFSIQIYKRIRALVWVTIGLAFLSTLDRKKIFQVAARD